jgi:pimeloyl-ACP methyl ester carboxylesterase
MLIITSLVLVCFLALGGALLVLSPGQPKRFVDQHGRPVPGSISEKEFVTINGVTQGMFITSTDATHPVLLYLHGGMPDFFLSDRYPTGLDNYFTVVWWERRGSGLSYNPDIPPETLTVEQAISDTLAMTNYLRQRFHQDKIYLMGHSGGTFIAIQAAARAPELYHAYIGVAQVSYQLRSEMLAYQYMLQQYKENGDTAMVRKLEAAPVTMTGGTPQAYLDVRDDAMHPLGIGTMYDMNSVLTGIVLPSLTSRDYTVLEKINLWRAKAAAGVSLGWDDQLHTDLSEKVPKLDLPVYFFEGIYDYTCSYTEAKAYFDHLNAPLKGFYTFEQSAHSPIYEEPQKVQRIIREDVLVGANRLADAR